MATQTTKTATKAAETAEKTVKKFKNSDPILCRSLVNGPLYVEGSRSKIPYVWADYGDEIDVEYQDLTYMIRSKDVTIFQPRILVLDEDMVAQNRELKKICQSIYSTKDLNKILTIKHKNKRSEMLRLFLY